MVTVRGGLPRATAASSRASRPARPSPRCAGQPAPRANPIDAGTVPWVVAPWVVAPWVVAPAAWVVAPWLGPPGRGSGRLVVAPGAAWLGQIGPTAILIV